MPNFATYQYFLHSAFSKTPQKLLFEFTHAYTHMRARGSITQKTFLPEPGKLKISNPKFFPRPFFKSDFLNRTSKRSISHPPTDQNPPSRTFAFFAKVSKGVQIWEKVLFNLNLLPPHAANTQVQNEPPF